MCKTFSFPLLRINWNYLKKLNKNLNLLNLILYIWFTQKNFIKAQKDGIIPEDEIYDYQSTILFSSNGKKLPLWASYSKLIEIRKIAKENNFKHNLSSS